MEVGSSPDYVGTLTPTIFFINTGI